MPTRFLLRGLAKLCLSIHKISSSSSDDSLQCRDPIKMKEAAEDKLSIEGNVYSGPTINVILRIQASNAKVIFHNSII